MEAPAQNQNVTPFYDLDWKVPNRYTNLVKIGRGGYGYVWYNCKIILVLMEQKFQNFQNFQIKSSANDAFTDKKVAIKKLTKTFEKNSDFEIEKQLLKLAYREVKILKHVKHRNVIKLLDIFPNFDDSKILNELYAYTLV